MSLLNAHVQTTLSIHQFVAAAEQFLNDPNLTAKYWPIDYYRTLQKLTEKVAITHNMQKKEKDILEGTHTPKYCHFHPDKQFVKDCTCPNCDPPVSIQLEDVFKS